MAPHKLVFPIATEQAVITPTTVQVIVTATAAKQVIAVAGHKLVIPIAARKPIIATTAVQVIVAALPVQSVVSFPAIQLVVAAASHQKVVPVPSVQDVITPASNELVIACPSEQDGVPSSGLQVIITGPAVHENRQLDVSSHVGCVIATAEEDPCALHTGGIKRHIVTAVAQEVSMNLKIPSADLVDLHPVIIPGAHDLKLSLPDSGTCDKRYGVLLSAPKIIIEKGDLDVEDTPCLVNMRAGEGISILINLCRRDHAVAPVDADRMGIERSNVSEETRNADLVAGLGIPHLRGAVG